MRETEEHERKLSEALRRENQQKQARRYEWEREAKEHERKLSEALRLENQQKQARRYEWEREEKEHERKSSEALRRENEEKQARRYEWEREVERHNREVKERREREAEEHNREVRERREREERERLRLNMFWTDPVSHTCTSYGTREYSALLVNIPEGYKLRVEACMATPVKIHGVEYKPKWCEDHVGVPLYCFRMST